MALPLLIAGGMGVLGLMSNNQEQKDKDANAAMQAEQYGMTVAGIDFAAERTGKFLMTKLRTAEEARVSAGIEVDKAQAQAASDAKVSAATAGVAGQSVEAVMNETERTAAEVKSSLSDQVRQQKLQLQVDYTDNFLNAKIQKGKLQTASASSGDRAKGGALAFVKGFVGGFL